MIFDAHAHYNDELYSDAERNEVIEYVFENGVKFILNAGTNIQTSKESIELAEKYNGIYAGVGFYPHDCINITDEKYALNILDEITKHPKVVSIAEIGLDYHYDDTPRDIQKKWFELQLDLSEQKNMPVCIHDREAHGDVLEILKRHKNAKGMLHSFSGSRETAEELLKLGWYISISGVVTFKNAVKLIEVVETLPLDKMLIETDTPYLSPVPNRGKRNNSANLVYTAQKIAEIKNMSVEDVCNITRQNACRLFRINE
ncbi:MAG: TatD family deoxyribonuclease [Ruminococcaceae bacterium]|nr:TatD family deoxyribonuclease [Oscillospiraceae bacterium]